MDPHLARAVEQAVLRDLRLRGVNPPAPRAVISQLVLSSPNEVPSTAQCVEAGKRLGLDLLLLIRIRNLEAGTRLLTELRVVDVATGVERGYQRLTLFSYAQPIDRRQLATDAESLVAAALADFPPPEQDLADVERALGIDADKLYRRYDLRTDSLASSFAQYLYNRAERRRNVSMGLGVAIPILLGSATVWFGIATRGIWDDGDHDSDDSDDSGDEEAYSLSTGFGTMMMELARFLVVAVLVVGSAATIAIATVASVVYRKREKELERLRPLLSAGSLAKPPPVSWLIAPYAAPGGGGLALELRF